MSYELHIARVVPWFYAPFFPILAEEALAVARHTPDMTVDESPARHPAQFMIGVGARGWLHYDDGRLRTRDPDDAMIGRMLRIAAELDAWVVDDEDELVGAGGVPQLPSPHFIMRESPLTSGEWADVVDAQPDFGWATSVETSLPSGRRRIPCPPVACWTGHPSLAEVPFLLEPDGAWVEVWDPDPPTLGRMRSLAGLLGDAAVTDSL